MIAQVLRQLHGFGVGERRGQIQRQEMPVDGKHRRQRQVLGSSLEPDSDAGIFQAQITSLLASQDHETEINRQDCFVYSSRNISRIDSL